jgi:hypothetical protein
VAKKILIVAAFPPGSAGGSWPIIEQLLKDYPQENIAWWFLGEPNQKWNSSYCFTNYFGPIPRFFVPGKWFKNFRTYLFNLIIKPLSLLHLLNFLKRINPDVLLTIPQGLTIPVIFSLIKLLKSVKLIGNTSFHVSVHDMADTANAIKIFGLNSAHQFQKKLEWIYQQADSRDCITKEMGLELQSQTGKKQDLVIMYGAEENEIRKVSNNKIQTHTSFINIGYAGTIISTNEFILFVNAIRLINNKYNYSISIHLFSNHNYNECSWFDPNLIINHGFLSGNKFREEYSKMNYALCLMPIGHDDHRYSDFSIPCKFTKSMAEGIPIICLAGKSTTVYKMISKYDAGFYSSAKTPSFLAEELYIFLSGNNKSSNLPLKMSQLLDSECHAGRNRTFFRKLISGNPFY